MESRKCSVHAQNVSYKTAAWFQPLGFAEALGDTFVLQAGC